MVVHTRNSSKKSKRASKAPSSTPTRTRSSRRINQYKRKTNDEDNISIVSDEEPTGTRSTRASRKPTSPSRQKKRDNSSRIQDDQRDREEEISTMSAEGDSNNNNILISPRQNEFSERTWWMVDIEQDNDYDNEGGPTNQGATPLIKRCMREHGWSVSKARKVLKAYRQFLTLKKEHKDWNATKLSPSYLIDLMWHQHLLDVVSYCHDTMLLCGHVVGHNPDGALEGKAERDAFTCKSLDQRFPNKYDKDVWGIQSYPEISTALKPKDDDKAINIRVRNLNGKEMQYKIGRSAKMELLFSSYANYNRVPLISLRFLLDGERIDPEASPKQLGLDDDDEIDVFCAQVGC